MIYHIIKQSDWTLAQKNQRYEPASIKSEGFIHFSDKNQVAMVANERFKNCQDLLLLTVDPEKLSGELKYEDRGDGNFFPHLYSTLGLDAVIKVEKLLPLEDGTFSF